MMCPAQCVSRLYGKLRLRTECGVPLKTNSGARTPMRGAGATINFIFIGRDYEEPQDVVGVTRFLWVNLATCTSERRARC